MLGVVVAGVPNMDVPVELCCCDPKILGVELTGLTLKLDADGSVDCVVLIVADGFVVAANTNEFDPIVELAV